MYQRRSAILICVALLLGVAGLVPATADDNPCQCKDLKVRCRITPKLTTLVGDEFCVEIEVENTSQLPLEEVTLRVRACPGVAKCLGDNKLSVQFPVIESGTTKTHRVCFQALRPGECQISCHAKDKEWFTAAGCACTALIKGLPAIQLEMIDLDRNRNPKGIFEMGEEFIYKCTIENDVGTSVTPDLSVAWKLPPELEFVRGVGDRGATITGSGQECTSSSFVLAPPSGVQNFEVTVRVIGVPAKNLVQTRATVHSPGGQPLALETESTTLKN